ncbi:hypothetical protein niasHT_029032 [Heterodera trifolii]|uniref:Uncharacterized protein n=1 Tax=Heterodera trifolii TaxID=157864 RepID=A0ABD2K8I4_9BILA
MTVIPRGNFLGCTYYLVPHELTNEQLLAGMHLKWGGGVYEVLKYKRMCGMAHDKPELESYAYTYVINKRLQKTLLVRELIVRGTMTREEVFG